MIKLDRMTKKCRSLSFIFSVENKRATVRVEPGLPYLTTTLRLCKGSPHAQILLRASTNYWMKLLLKFPLVDAIPLPATYPLQSSSVMVLDRFVLKTIEQLLSVYGNTRVFENENRISNRLIFKSIEVRSVSQLHAWMALRLSAAAKLT